MFGKKDDKTGNDADDKKGKEGQPDMAAITKSLTDFTASFQKQIETLPTSIARATMAGVSAALKEGMPAPEPKKKSAEPVSDPVDLEKMSRAEYGKHIARAVTTAVMGQVTEELGKVSKQITQVAETADRADIRQDFDELGSKDPDLEHFHKEMGVIAKQYPHLTPADLLTLAKGQSPDKVKELADERQKEADKVKEEERGGKSQFGGMMPTSAVGDTKPGKMEPKEAAEKAWADSMASIPQELFSADA